MKPSLTAVLLIISAVWPGAVHGQEAAQPTAQPLVAISIKNYPDFVKQAARVADAVAPGQGASLDAKLRGVLGSPNLAGIDAGRPWTLAVWGRGIGAPPLSALSIPVSDFEAFKKGLEPNKGLGGPRNKILPMKNHALALLPGPEADAADEKMIERWEQSAPRSQAHAFELRVAMNPVGRALVIGGLKMAEMTLSQSLTNAPMGAAGANGQALRAWFDLYFRALEGVVTGLDHASLEADADEQGVELYGRIRALKGSDLAGWLKGGAGNLPVLSAFIDPHLPMSLAMRLQADPSTQAFLEKALRLSLQMQNQPADETTLHTLDQLAVAVLPMEAVASFGFEHGYRFGGCYEFPGRDAGKVYEQLLQFIKKFADLPAEKESVYSGFHLQRNVRRIEGAPVDQLTLTINTNSPLFKMPGQKEAFQAMWPSGNVVIDYTVKDGRVFMASGLPLEESMKTSAAPFAFPVRPQTVAFGNFNLVELMKTFNAANPTLPENAREKFSRLDPAGAAIPFKIDLDEGLESRARLPLKFLKALGQLAPKPPAQPPRNGL